MEVDGFWQILNSIWEHSGLVAFASSSGIGNLVMIATCSCLLFLSIFRNIEPYILVPLAFGGILANIPQSGLFDPGSLLDIVIKHGIHTGALPLIIFLGIGALTDFGPTIANPKTFLLGAAAQFGIFGTMIFGGLLCHYLPSVNFSLKDIASIAIIGGADGPTSIYLSNKLAPNLLGAIAVAAYSYMALVPIIQPPILRFLTTEKERKIEMKQLRVVTKSERLLLPCMLLLISALFLPSSVSIISFFAFGNILRECGVVERLSDTVQNSLMNIATILLGLGVGAKLNAEHFLNLQTLGILVLGAFAFALGTASGVIFAKIMNIGLKVPMNPLIGGAGVSAVPMSARVVHKVGLEANPDNFLLMHAMGPNAAGQIGSALAAGVILAALS